MKYTALTIGPIHKTFQSVKSTKAIWAASYMFSYIMKKIIKEIKSKLRPNDVIILPHFEDFEDDDTRAVLGVGLFPDRLIVKGEIPELKSILDRVIKEFAQKVNDDINDIENDVIDYFKEYLKINVLEVELDEKTNVIHIISELLDTSELKQPVRNFADKDYLIRFLEKKYYNFLVTSEFDNHNKRFPSTIEIANSELKDIDSKKFNSFVNELFKGEKDEDTTDNQQQFIEKIKTADEFKATYRNYQKYIAVVQADGDNIGNFISELYELPDTNEMIKRFSKNLLQFGKESVALINEYHGTPVYAGGDDLLFMAPVAHTKIIKGKVVIKKSILSLIDEIDKIFNKYFTDYTDDGFDFANIINRLKKKPGMSYGISVSYYKFPLSEALAEGVRLLFGTAKKTCNKNAVSYAVLKHSGQYFGTTFHKNEPSYTSYKELIKQQVQDADYIHRVVYKLEPLQSVFLGIGFEADDKERNEKFDNFFVNNFNESIHLQKVSGKKELIPFLKSLKQLFKDVYTEHRVSNGKDEDEKKAINTYNLNKIYAALRFIGFLNNKEER